MMASDPQFFVSILSDVFVEDGADPDKRETTEDERARSSASYRLLISLGRSPGQLPNGSIDATALKKWVDGALEAATKEKRQKVVHAYIGRALAHSPELHGVWPQRPIADVIERLKSVVSRARPPN